MSSIESSLGQQERAADLLGSGVEEQCQFVVCRIGGEEFAIDVLTVQEINRLAEVTRVPKTPAYVEGVINLRGRIIPVLDLRQRFGLTSGKQTGQTRVVVVSLSSRLVGLVVDAVVEVLNLPKTAIEAPPSLGNSVGADYTMGVGRLENRLLIILDLNRLLHIRQDA